MSCLSCSVPPLGCTDFQRFSYTTPLTSHSSSSPSLRCMSFLILKKNKFIFIILSFYHFFFCFDFWFCLNLGNGKVRRRISRSSSYSSNLWGSQLPSFNGSYEPCFSIVRIWISPLCMGRRSSKIATRKVIYFAILFNTFSITHFKLLCLLYSLLHVCWNKWAAILLYYMFHNSMLIGFNQITKAIAYVHLGLDSTRCNAHHLFDKMLVRDWGLSFNGF